MTETETSVADLTQKPEAGQWAEIMDSSKEMVGGVFCRNYFSNLTP